MSTFRTQSMAKSQLQSPAAAGMIAQMPAAPAGTFLPGTKVQVGSHRVVIDRYLSEGGFAHVYVVTLPKPVNGEDKAVLKRVAVPDKEHLANMRTEVETMKRLKGHKQVVEYIDSHASPLKSGGFEVFLLMEFCQGGGLIDFMNTRLQNRLTEPEILKIFTDIAEGVACMHYLKPPLLHRDLKIENVLISKSGKNKTYKLCDFGSTAPPRPAAMSAAEARLIEDDIQRHTTMQYRSPEMVDVYRKLPIDEKSDIWALGCFLYKLCYYTTPFEDVGQMAILNAKFKFPGYPKFSDQLKLLIANMLREQPAQRPNIYQVLQKACQLDNRPLSLKDIYSERTQSEARRNEVLPKPDSAHSRAGAILSPPTQQKPEQSIPNIEPMRRGRPSQPNTQPNSAKPSPSPLRIIGDPDPFAQLDGVKVKSGDELSDKFPTLDQFSLMTDSRKKYAFHSQPSKPADSKPDSLNDRVTQALADEAFGRSPSPIRSGPVPEETSIASARATATLKEPTAQTGSAAPAGRGARDLATKPVMVSTGTMTSPQLQSPISVVVSDRPIYKFPPRSVDQSQAALPPRPSAARPPIVATKSGSRLAHLLRRDAAESQGSVEDQISSSSRPSMEGRRPMIRDFDSGINRSQSLNMRHRPVSINLGSGPTHIKDREILKSSDESQPPTAENRGRVRVSDSETNITSDIDFLRLKEEEDRAKTQHVKRVSSGSRHSKRNSLPSIAVAGTKNIFSGRFGEAFKRYEGQNEVEDEDEAAIADQPETLTPIAGSEVTDLSEDRNGFEETEELSPEMRRELEKRQLEAEERRVANAAAEYRRRTGIRAGPPPPSTKAASIQNRVKSLLQDSERPVQKTATGYGQYTNQASPGAPEPHFQKAATFQQQDRQAPVPRQIAVMTAQDTRSTSMPASLSNSLHMERPTAPPKPQVLRTGRNEVTPPAVVAHIARSGYDQPGVGSPEDWEEQFSKRYPSLNHLEMVETEIKTPVSELKTKEI